MRSLPETGFYDKLVVTRDERMDSDALVNSSKLLDYDTPAGVDVDVIAIAVLARCCVVAVSIAFLINHLITRKSLQCDRSLEVLDG